MGEEAKDRGEKVRKIEERERKKRNAAQTRIQRGLIALILAIAVYLAILDVDKLGIWKTLITLLLISLVIGAEVVSEKRTRDLEEENRELKEDLQIPRAYERI